MPDVIIKGMEMPTNCTKCFMLRNCNLQVPADGRNKDCQLRPAPEWISVKEMPPPNNTPIQLLINRKFQVVARLRKNEWIMPWNFEPLDLDSTDVLHWMPLPEPPEGGDGDEP